MTTKQLILITEGADMTGKTNILNELGRRLDLKKFKNIRENNRWWDPEVDFKYGVEAIVQMSEQLKLSFMLDRFHASEYAYSKVYDRLTNESRIMDVDLRISKLNGVIIYCYKTPDKYLADDGGIIDVNKYDEIKKYYDEFFNKTKCHIIKLNTNDENLKEQCDFIIKNLKGLKLI